MVGNAHVDPVWLWGWQSGVDEALATCRSAADRCDEHPEFVFTRGEAWVYRWVERIDPELSARIDALVARGQWHPTGGQVVQPDANLPTAEGWRRQLRHGRRYFQERFGVTPRVLYDVDTFGHPASLPDLLVQEGYEALVFHRPQPHQVELPAAAFRWRGSGGAEVLACRLVPGYVTRERGDLSAQVAAALAAADPGLGHALCFYGVGDHGGGPTKANIEWIRDARVAGAELRFSTPEEFFAAIAARREVLPVVDVELQRCFPGCYSVMHDVKAAQRRGERGLAAAERIVERFADAPAPLRERLDAAWEDLLFCQFHDVLSGTSAPGTWDAVRAMQGRARIAGEEVVVEATRRRALTLAPAPHRRIVLMHAGERPWEGLVEAEPFLDFDPWGERWLSERDGTPLPFQRVQPDAQALTSRVVFPLALAPGEVREVLVREDPPRAAALPADLAATPDRLGNARLAVELASGAVALDGERVLEGIGLHLRHDSSDTWTWDADRFDEPVAAALAPGPWTVQETGPLRARVHREARLGDARLGLTLTLAAGSPVLGLDLEVLWAERLKALQLVLALPHAPAEWEDGLPGGSVRRRPGGTEWPVCGWSRVGSLALVTHDAYSLSLQGRAWQWTLLRSPKMAWGGGRPDPYGGRDVHSDQGEHRFAFELLPAAELDPDLRAQAAPPVVFERAEGVDRPPAAVASGAHVPVLFHPRERR